MSKLRVWLCVVTAALFAALPQTAMAGSLWFSTPAPCAGYASQDLTALNPNITEAAGWVEGTCTHGRITSYVKLFSMNLTYSTGKRATFGAWTPLYAPNQSGAYGNPNGMWVDRWVSATVGSTFVAP